MPKINVYLPDELADAVREAGLPVSSICQRALEQAVRRTTAIRQATLDDIRPDLLAARLPSFTARLVTTVTLAADRAKAAGSPHVTTGDLLAGMIAEGGNLALQILTALEIEPGTLLPAAQPSPPPPGPAGAGPAGARPAGAGPAGAGPAAEGPAGARPAEARPAEAGPAGPGLRFSSPAAVAVELAVGEAIGLGHNYVGCEHLLIALAAETDGTAGELLRARGADGRAVRRAVAAAIAGYAHLRASVAAAPTAPPAGILTAVRAELAPLIERIERLENRLN
ncbi:Clp protease N-terminal domain-containing protein [Paractinoplanes globisporus]|uniref:Clp protease N-terminal domain-containing protein n=1 Tax=Paractinoplanes globisporus TaxID=113565 RepID=A0ABW6WNA6_9ACTN|nr:Clp protease N-terminal domain-containing protein [Actinoplanes globisporus]